MLNTGIKKKAELLAPAGSLEKLKSAILYGANAVYCGLGSLNLRVRAENFSPEQMSEGITFAHERDAKVYLTLNAFLFESDLSLFDKTAREAVALKPDGVIVSDPASVVWFRKNAPEMEIHLSTQAGCMNSAAAEFWREQGVSRVILAREVSLEHLKAMKEKTSLEIEIFVHGAMCAAVSGRCLMSSYLAQRREADQGDCQQPCRWIYKLKDVKGGGTEYPVMEDESGTTIFSAKDLCLFDYIPDLARAGISSFKIEGRMKTEYYVAVIARAYRKALDLYYENPEKYQTPEQWRDELFKVSHREYSTGFLFGREEISQTYRTECYIRNTIFKAFIPEQKENRGDYIETLFKDATPAGDKMEAVMPERDIEVVVESIRDMDGIEISQAEPGQLALAKFSKPLKPYTYLRKPWPAPFMRI